MTALQKLRSFIQDYCHFAEPEVIRPLALWILGTFLYEMFDSFPYLVITANVKRAGKTRLSELIGFTCQMPFSVAGASAASLFRIIKDNKPTILWDEAETLSSESSSLVRAFLNVGYRKGQTIPRVTRDGVVQWPTYCPKVFVLIGDVYDTLKDRSIVIQMQRGEPRERFSYETAKSQGFEIAEELKSLAAEKLPLIQSAYEEESCDFLTDRDAEIWRPLLALARAVEPESVNVLKRTAVDLATEKTLPSRSYAMQGDAEKLNEREEYAHRALKDMLEITAHRNPLAGNQCISSIDAVQFLRDLDTAPWRKYSPEANNRETTKGFNPTEEGLTQRGLATLLSVFSVHPKPIRFDNKKNGKNQKVFRGYARKDLLAAAKKAGLT